MKREKGRKDLPTFSNYVDHVLIIRSALDRPFDKEIRSVRSLANSDLGLLVGFFFGEISTWYGTNRRRCT